MKMEMEKEADTGKRSEGLRQQAATTGQQQGPVESGSHGLSSQGK